MLHWSAVCFILALIAAILGFGGIAVGAAVFKVAFFVLLVAFVVFLIAGVFARAP